MLYRTIRWTVRSSALASLALLFSLALVAPPAAQAASDSEDEVASTLGETFKKGKWGVSFRPRFEFVDDDAARFEGRDGEALTLRSGFVFQSAPLSGFTFGLEVEDVSGPREELYNNVGARSLHNGVTNRPVVADPDLTEINQAWVAYDFGGQVAVKAGRFEKNLGDQRFVGAVAWRQNHQSFDAVSIDTAIGEGKEAWKLSYVFLDRVHTITGARQDLTGHLADVRRAFGGGVLGISGQWLDYDAAALSGRSRATVAVSFTGSSALGSSGLAGLYDLQFARQDDYGDNAADLSHDYLRVEGGLKQGAWSARLGTEVLEGDGTTAFITPLATLHKFNGFADKFLATPANGLEDLYLKLGWGKGVWNVQAAYHDFSAENTSGDYGTEVDALVTWKAPGGQVVGLKIADYSADGFSTDVQKAMLFSVLRY